MRAAWVLGSTNRQKNAPTTATRHIRRTKIIALPTIYKLYSILIISVKSILPILTGKGLILTLIPPSASLPLLSVLKKRLSAPLFVERGQTGEHRHLPLPHKY
jgi:hypothetical protein